MSRGKQIKAAKRTLVGALFSAGNKTAATAVMRGDVTIAQGRKILAETAAKPRANPSVPKRARDLAALLKVGHAEGVAMHDLMVVAETTNDQKMVDSLLSTANKVMEGHGIEAIRGKYHDRYYGDIVGLYVNMSDTYNTTVLFDTVKRRFLVTDMGAFVEKNDRAYKIV